MSAAQPSLSLRRYGESPGSHSHPHFQVLWGWQGVLDLEIEGRGHRVGPGRIAVIAPGDRHDFRALRGAGREAQCFVLDAVDDRLDPLAGRVVSAAPSLPSLLQFLSEQSTGSPTWQLAMPLLLESLPRSPVQAMSRRSRPIDWAQLQAWVDARLDRPIEVSELARQVHLSAAQFTVRCQDQWGCAPSAWVRQRRLALATRLRAQGLAVGVIALQCGYRSPSALTAALRRQG